MQDLWPCSVAVVSHSAGAGGRGWAGAGRRERRAGRQAEEVRERRELEGWREVVGSQRLGEGGANWFFFSLAVWGRVTVWDGRSGPCSSSQGGGLVPPSFQPVQSEARRARVWSREPGLSPGVTPLCWVHNTAFGGLPGRSPRAGPLPSQPGPSVPRERTQPPQVLVVSAPPSLAAEAPRDPCVCEP